MMSENILLHCFICISLNISGGEFFPQWHCHLSTFMASLCISGINQRFFKWFCSNLIYNFAVQEKNLKLISSSFTLLYQPRLSLFYFSTKGPCSERLGIYLCILLVFIFII